MEKREVTLNSIGESIGKLDGRLDKIDDRIVKIDGRIDKIDERFDKIDERMDKFDHRMDKFDQRMDGFDRHMEQVMDSIEDLAQMTANGFNEMTTMFKELKTELKTDIERIDLGLQQTVWQGDYRVLDERVKKLERKATARAR